VQRDLVEQAQHGDREAFGILAGAWVGQLYSVAKLMLSDDDLAEDTVQETLIVTWRDLRALRDPDRFDSWLHQILVRTVYRVARGERRRIDRQRIVDSDAVSTPGAEHDLADRDEIDRGFRRLKTEFRAVLVLHYYLGFSDEEAAAVLGVPPGTYKSRLHRATGAMRAELEADARGGQRSTTGAIR
jgi:RNA polymerase sigma-70 factor (ECF subfamily)